MSHLTISSIVPPATVLPYAGSAAPSGWLLCNGDQISRTTYAALFSVIGTTYGHGNGTTTFNLPDYRWVFLRGLGQNITASGNGTAANNEVIFTSHGFNRSGIKVRMTLGTIPGLASYVDYWVIVVDSNKLAFATSRSNSLSGIKISISGSYGAVIQQSEDEDTIVREATTVGGNSGVTVGGFQDSKTGRHTHGSSTSNRNGTMAAQIYISGSNNPHSRIVSVDAWNAQRAGNADTLAASVGNTEATPVVGETDPNNSSQAENRPANVAINYIIRY